MKYTIKQFRSQFPNDKACLDYIFKARFGSDYICPKCGKRDFYPIKNRKCYSCACGYQVHPVANTIFHKSATKLTDWFFAIYLISNSKNGVSAKEVERHLGVTYKCAWRMTKQIRSLMKQGNKQLSGIVEADETFIGGKRRLARKNENKTPVIGIVERGGEVKASKVSAIQTHILLKELKDNIKFGSRLITDDFPVYKKAPRIGLFHSSINHSKGKYVEGDIYTNTIEGFWSQLKRSLDGTYHSVSAKHLQSYVDEFAFSYNQRLSGVSVFETLLFRLCEQHGQEGQRILSSVLVRV